VQRTRADRAEARVKNANVATKAPPLGKLRAQPAVLLVTVSTASHRIDGVSAGQVTAQEVALRYRRGKCRRDRRA
jgi:hypothetical protein